MHSKFYENWAYESFHSEYTLILKRYLCLFPLPTALILQTHHLIIL